MNLHNEEEVFKELVEATANEIGVPNFYIEKDYWVTQSLKMISKDNTINQSTIFKGGTALSKVHGIIKRFSEDIDFAVTEEIRDQTQSHCKRILKKIQDVARSHPDMSSIKKETEELSSNQEFKRFCTYNAFFPFPVAEYSQSKEEIIIEVNSFGVPKPHEMSEIYCYIGQFCRQNDESLVTKYNLEPFNLHVISQERAFLDKIIAIQKAYFKYNRSINNEKDKQEKKNYERQWFVSKMRHLYDLSKLIQVDSVKTILPDLLDKLGAVIKSDIGKCSISEINESDLFNIPDQALSTFSTDWNRLEPMLYKKETLPTIEEIVSLLSLIKSYL